MCGCGCNTCETKPAVLLNESKAAKEILSEGLKYHLDNNRPLTDHLYRAGSTKYFDLFAEARALYAREILEFSGSDLEILTETDLGHFGIYEGKKVPLDFPIEIIEAKKDIYDKFLDDPQNPKGRAKAIISKFLKQYGEDATGMAVDRFASQNNLKPEEKYILKYITKNDIKISSQPGGPNLSVLKEAKYQGKKVQLNSPKRGGSKKFFVYVKDPKTKKIKKVSFGGTTGLKAKINDPEARRNFAKRHNCAEKKDKTKPGYWSCRLPRYSKLLGLKGSYTGFW
jgi:hypothetical protein